MTAALLLLHLLWVSHGFIYIAGEEANVEQQVHMLQEQVLNQTKQINKILSIVQLMCTTLMEEEKCAEVVKEANPDETERQAAIEQFEIIPIQAEKFVSSTKEVQAVIVFDSKSDQLSGYCTIGMDEPVVYEGTITVISAPRITPIRYNFTSVVKRPQNSYDFVIFGYFSCNIMAENSGIRVSFNRDADSTSTRKVHLLETPGPGIFAGLSKTIHLERKQNQILRFHTDDASVAAHVSTDYTWADDTGQILKYRNYNIRTVPTENGLDLIETIPNSSFVSSGGFLDLIITIAERGDEVLDNVAFKYQMVIIGPGEEAPFKEGKVYLHEEIIEDTVYIEPPLGRSIECVAFGNPVSSLNIYRQLSNGTLLRINTISEIATYKTRVYATLGTDIDQDIEGQYLCKATSTEAVTEKIFTIERWITVHFNEDWTRVLYNSSDQVVIGCEAVGNPMPTLEFRPNDYSQERLVTTEETVDTHNHYVRSILAIEPRDPSIWRVFCVALTPQYVYHTIIQIASKPS